VWDPSRLGYNPFEGLFRYLADAAIPEGMFPADLPIIPGLKALRRLQFFVQVLDVSWCLLPNLSTLELARDCLRPDVLKACADGLSPLPRPTLSNLIVEASTSLTVIQATDNLRIQDRSFLSSATLPNLRGLSIYLTKVVYEQCDHSDGSYSAGRCSEILEYPSDGSSAAILSCLDGTESRLLYLKIDAYSDLDTSFLDLIEPATSMLMFDNLRYLIVPQNLLLDQQYGTEATTMSSQHINCFHHLWRPRP
jgi:hypothetical protein